MNLLFHYNEASCACIVCVNFMFCSSLTFCFFMTLLAKKRLSGHIKNMNVIFIISQSIQRIFEGIPQTT